MYQLSWRGENARGAGCRCRLGTIAAAHTVLGAQYSAARLAGETCPVLRSAPPVHPAPPLHTASVRADTVDTLHPDHLLDGDTLAGLYNIQIVTRAAIVSQFSPAHKMS